MNKDEICRLVKKALYAADDAAKLAFDGSMEDDEPSKIRKESGAVDTALLGLSYIQTARTLVALSDEPDTLFNQVAEQYDAFAREITRDYSTHHSHQWTLIERDRLLKMVEGSEYDIETE